MLKQIVEEVSCLPISLHTSSFMLNDELYT